MILGLEFPPISHVVEWPTLFGDGPFAVNKVIILMWLSAALAFGVMFLGGRKQALVPTGMQNVAESVVTRAAYRMYHKSTSPHSRAPRFNMTK